MNVKGVQDFVLGGHRVYIMVLLNMLSVMG